MLTSMLVSCPEAAVDVQGDTIVVRSGALSGLFASDTEMRIPLALVTDVQADSPTHVREMLRTLRLRSVLTDAEYDALSRRVADGVATTEWLSRLV
jgi:F420-0:gamma-glutamyl ligase-like protein